MIAERLRDEEIVRLFNAETRNDTTIAKNEPFTADVPLRSFCKVGNRPIHNFEGR